jgi:hypothetical protein
MKKILFAIITMLAITHGAKADPLSASKLQTAQVDLSKAEQKVTANTDGTATVDAVMYDSGGNPVTLTSQNVSVDKLMFQIKQMTGQIQAMQDKLDQLNALLPAVQDAQNKAILKLNNGLNNGGIDPVVNP